MGKAQDYVRVISPDAYRRKAEYALTLCQVVAKRHPRVTHSPEGHRHDRKSTLDPQVKALLDNLNLDDGDGELLSGPPRMPLRTCTLYEHEQRSRGG
ncbi:MAG: hypothetical protein U1F42_03195 [Candidatus Competibacteraceae bacterium]